ncbi:MAG: PHP domain-containing protein, partial [Cyclobacteriaceae bacterium]|nr:PHP domain-containing protein [Cyclobacteriaceae bacterium]
MYLNCHTGFSFKYGTLPIKMLFEEARRCGIHKLALTEINNMASYLEMLRICDENKPYENGLTRYGKPAHALDIAVGVDIRNNSPTNGETVPEYILLAQNNDGFERINRFVSHHIRESKPYPTRAPEMKDIIILYPFQKFAPDQLRENEYIGVQKKDLLRYAVHLQREEYAHKFVAHHSVTLLPPEKVKDPKTKKEKTVYRDHNIHRLLRCIAHNTLLSKLPAQLQADRDEYMLPHHALWQEFRSFPELLDRAQALLDSCSLECALGEDKNKKFFTSSAGEDSAFLREETEKGYMMRYGTDRNIWNKHIEKELKIIHKKQFTAYYLIAYDLIRFAKKMNYDFVGRGSGANSTVAYCLGITNVDPIELDLYFERFLNEERVSPPDFDIDFSWDNRDAIYDYLFQRYGPDHICLLGTHVTYQGRSIVRELGKVFGLPKEEIDVLVESRKEDAERDHIAQKVMTYARYIVERELPANIS